MADYKRMMQKGVQTVNQWAESIAGSSYWQKIAPGMKQLQQEVGEKIMKNASGISDDSIQSASNAIAEMFLTLQDKPRGQTEIEQLSKTFAQKISKNSAEADIEKIFKENIGIFQGKDYTNALNGAKARLQRTVYDSPEQAYNTLWIEKLKEIPKAYFTNPNKDIRNARIQAAVGGYAALAVGGRYLSGGTLTKDSYGRGDIAGIPFI